MKTLSRRALKNPESRLFCGFRLFGLRKLPMEASWKSRGVLFTTSLRSTTFSPRALGYRTTDGQKFLTHQFTFLDPPIFLARKLILPTTSFKPAFWTHQCFRPSLDHQTVVKRRSSRLNFWEGPIAVFRICKRYGERESRRGEQQEQCQPREHLFIGGKGSTRLCCAYF
jgi:hypothetical protein